MWTERSFRRSVLLLGLLVGVVYGPSLRAGFHYDDFHSIVHNPHLTTNNLGAFYEDPGLFSVNPNSAMYRPFLLTTFSLNRLISGGHAWSYHLVNVLLHAASTIAVYWLVQRLGQYASVSVLASVLFGIHPINSEAVIYVSSRSELLETLGVLLFCGLTLTRSKRVSQGVGAIASLLVALLSKSIAVVAMPLALLGLATGRRSRSDRQPLVILFSVCGAAVIGYLMMVRSLLTRAVFEAPVRDAGVQLATQLKALGYYLWLMVMPVRLSVEHQFEVSRSAEPTVLLAAACIGSILYIAWRARALWRWGVAWWLVFLLPTAIVPLIVLVNEHRLYGASVGVLTLISLVVVGLQRRAPRMAVGWIAVYTICLTILTIQRIEVWSTERTVWQDAAAKAPASVKAQLRWADALAADGEFALAEEAYLRAVALRGQHAGALNNLGRLYLLQGRWEEAQQQFETLLQVSPDNVPARMNLGQVHFRQRRLDAARREYLAAVAIDGTGGRAQLRIAQIDLQQGLDPAMVLDWLRRAAEAGETSADLQVSRGIAWRRMGDRPAALRAYQAAVAMDSTSADAWFNLGNLYVELAEHEKAASAYGLAIEYSVEGDAIHQAARQRQSAVINKNRGPAVP